MNRLLLLPLLLLPLGCSLCAPPLFQTVPVAGDAAGLRMFAGRWFDEEGNLIAVVSSPPGAQLSILTPYSLEPKDAQLRNGTIVFRLASDDPEEVSLRLQGEDELLVSVAREKSALLLSGSCSCGTDDPLPVTVLLREPSPVWHMQHSVRKAQEGTADLARIAYNGAMDWLAQAL